MEYLIEHLARHGITEIMVNVAYHHQKIEEYFGDGGRWGVQIGYSYEGARPGRHLAAPYGFGRRHAAHIPDFTPLIGASKSAGQNMKKVAIPCLH